MSTSQNPHKSKFLQNVQSQPQRYLGSMLLEPRSLFIMTDEAYSTMLHGICERKTDYIDEHCFNASPEQMNQVLTRGTRISITVRNVEKISKLSVTDMLFKK
ncbi:unnamed protein product [Caenorhabditis angaria]|uniref:Alpha-ketoglutarate-dependent dioxygenase AlkB-like domain-containing protein n=1 Tax=Caenorhabditis angaria TaxID=860376 RepID=A0A9P1INU7_9PELO|nr:unnamed protein product [Caenorhabditis angaria]